MASHPLLRLSFYIIIYIYNYIYVHIYFIYLKSDIYILDNERYIIIYYKYKYYNPSLLLLPIFIFINYYIVGSIKNEVYYTL